MGVEKLNLDELRKAREELDKERGVVTPKPAKKVQKEYHEEKIEENNDYKNSESESVESKSTSESNSSTIFGDDGDNGSQNFSAYDNFAPFEINDTPLSNSFKAESKSETRQATATTSSGSYSDDSKEQDTDSAVTESSDSTEEKLKVNSLEELLNNVSSIDDLLKYDLDSIQLPDDGNNADEKTSEVEDEKTSESNEEFNGETTSEVKEPIKSSSDFKEDAYREPYENQATSSLNSSQPKPQKFETLKSASNTEKKVEEPKRFDIPSTASENRTAPSPVQSAQTYSPVQESRSAYPNMSSRNDEFSEYGRGFDEFEDEYSQTDSYTESEIFEESYNEEKYDNLKRSYDVDGAYGGKYAEDGDLDSELDETKEENGAEENSAENAEGDAADGTEKKEKYVPSADSIISERIINEQKKAEMEAENAEAAAETNAETEAEQEKKEDTSPLKKIDKVNFIDIIKSNSFMDSDKLTCIYGTDEENSVICQNFKDFYNTAIFCDDEDDVFKLFSSIILSLTLKNVNYEMKFVICDSNNGTKYEYYNDLSYMFFNRVAKTNNEIIDTLYELTLEIDKRYENLAKINSPNIENFNDIMQNADIPPMPYIVLFFDHYQRAVHLDDSDMINSYLKYIVKFGRLVGVYVNVVFDSDEIDDKLNHNLSTRISFKTELRETSILRIGKSGAERLTETGEYIVKSLFNDDIIHLKVPNITAKEVALLVKNIDR